MDIYKIKYLLACTIYGTIGYILSFINLPSEIVVLGRGVIGSIFIYLYLRFTGKNLDFINIKKNIKYLVLSGVSLGLNWVFLFAAYRVSTAALGSLLNYTAPIILVIIAPIVFKERISLKKVPCIVGAFLGIIFVSGILETNVKVNVAGMVLGILAAFAFVMLIIFNRKLSDINAYDKAVVQLSVSALTVLPYVIFNNLNTSIILDAKSLLLVLLLGIVHTGVAYCLYFGSINDISVQVVAVFGYIEPVIMVLSSALLMHEPISTFGVIGANLIIVSAIMSELIK